MKIKNQKGFVGTDITVAIIIIMLFVSITSVVLFNLTKNSKGIERQSNATYIATDVIETIKLIPYNNLELTSGETQITKTGSNWGYVSNGSNTVNLGEIIELTTGYTCYVTVERIGPSGEPDPEAEDYVKKVTVRVSYKVADKVENVTLSTAVLRDV